MPGAALAYIRDLCYNTSQLNFSITVFIISHIKKGCALFAYFGIKFTEKKRNT